MPDRSPRLLTFPPLKVQGGERGATLLRERPASPSQTPPGGRDGDGRAGGGGHEEHRDQGGQAGQAGDGARGGQQDDNPFAPPPEGTPDRPWQPRHPEGSQGSGSSWGGQWSDRQPGRAPGNFGERPGGGPEGQGGRSGMRWDPADPAQRRARYALLSGMWAIFFVLLGWPYVSLLLGALALYWGVSALRAKSRPAEDPDRPAPAAPPGPRPQTMSAIGGLVSGALALVLVGGVFSVQVAYRDYYTCVNDALTRESKQSCDQMLPRELRGILSAGND
ncbi:hypothetical protein [Streptomyces sp. NPDC005573]|uniref:hypothetical protein n=1 Tax=unclassified Streptomyces TaxID=2593676 RepID=UPI0033B28590